jgi:CDGSH-type Zn-finger protein
MATKVTVFNNAPLVLEGEFTIHDQSGAEYGLAGRTKISLCRCGLSENKPFCDGKHKGAFASECAARELPPPAPKP